MIQGFNLVAKLSCEKAQPRGLRCYAYLHGGHRTLTVIYCLDFGGFPTVYTMYSIISNSSFRSFCTFKNSTRV